MRKMTIKNYKMPDPPEGDPDEEADDGGNPNYPHNNPPE